MDSTDFILLPEKERETASETLCILTKKRDNVKGQKVSVSLITRLCHKAL
jgi:hypothetical protein